MKTSPLAEVASMNGQVLVKAVASSGKGLASSVRINQSQSDNNIPDVVVQQAQEPDSATEGANAVAPATPDQVAAMIQSAIAPMQDSIEAKNSAISEASQKIADLEQQLKQAKDEAEVSIAQAKLDAEQALQKAENDAATAADLKLKLETAQKAETAMNELGKLVGNGLQTSQPQTIEVLGTGSQEMRTWQKMLEQAPRSVVMHNNQQFVQKDDRAARSYMLRNQAKIRDGVEAELRSAGFLQGAGAIVTNAPTLVTDIPSSSFTYLSDWIRRPTDNTLIYEQFAREYAVPGIAPRLQGQVPRYPFSPGPATTADRTLTPGTDIVAARQNVVEDLVPVTILELGLGKDANNAPLALTHFVQAFSMTNLEQIVSRNLGRDYQRSKDLFIRTQYFTANTVVYNNRGRVVSTPGAVVAGGVGHATRGHLRALRATMSTQQIPTYSNGCYVITMTPNQVQYLLDELATQQRFPEPNSVEIEMISKVLQNQEEDYGGAVSGYRTTLDGFMIFEQNVHSIGAAGTPGAQTETFGTGATLTETCFAFGADAVCWATALPVEIRQDEVTNFRRRDSWIWYSHENAATLDINEVLDGGRITRERRVLQVRYSRDPVPAA